MVQHLSTRRDLFAAGKLTGADKRTYNNIMYYYCGGGGGKGMGGWARARVRLLPVTPFLNVKLN